MGGSEGLPAKQLAGLCEGPVEQIRIRVLPDGRVSRRDAARYLGCESKTLAMWAPKRKGPPPVKVGGRVYYWLHDLEKFVAAQTGLRERTTLQEPDYAGSLAPSSQAREAARDSRRDQRLSKMSAQARQR
jgi:hypothetical protein